MVEKVTRGLPDSFSLEDAADLPSAPGDFLDELDSDSELLFRARQRSAQQRAAAAAEAPVEKRPAETVPQVVPLVKALAEPQPLAATGAVERSEENAGAGRGELPLQPEAKKSSLSPAWKRQRRRQLNMSAEAEDMLESLLRYFKQYGSQEDFKMSELFEALLRVASDAKEHLDLSQVPKRGAWGSASERNFSVSIAEALSKAFQMAYSGAGARELLAGNE